MRGICALVITMILVTGCRRSGIAAGVSDSTYVRVIAELRHLPYAAGGDTTTRARARDSILRAYGVTAAQLKSATAALASQPDRAGATVSRHRPVAANIQTAGARKNERRRHQMTPPSIRFEGPPYLRTIIFRIRALPSISRR